MIRLNTEPKKIENFCMNGYYFSFDSFDEDSKKNFFYFANQIILNENFINNWNIPTGCRRACKFYSQTGRLPSKFWTYSNGSNFRQ